MEMFNVGVVGNERPYIRTAPSLSATGLSQLNILCEERAQGVPITLIK
jgi:hypothetical protein